MTVEARHLNFFSPQLIGNREMMNPIETNINIYNTQMGYSSLLPSSGTTTGTGTGTGTATETLLLPAFADSLSQKTIYNVPLSRKRSRDDSNSINPSFPSYSSSPPTQSHKSTSVSSFFLMGQDFSFPIQQQQLDIDHIIAQHMEKVRMELEEKRKCQARRLIETIEVNVMKRLKAKEEEIEKIGKMNWALEERVKSLYTENQLWRDLAQSNEATANALRTNLEQVLAQRAGAIDDDGDTVYPGAGMTAALMDDAQSCCDSSDSINEDGATKKIRNSGESGCSSRFVNSKRLCRSCGKDESCVLILPCRHLCLCTVCGSTLHICPVCKSLKTGSIHVNMS